MKAINHIVPVVVFGGSGHAKVILSILKGQSNFNILGIVDSFLPKEEKVMGYPVLGTEDDILSLKKKLGKFKGIIGIGLNWTRKSLAIRIRKIDPSFEFINAIHPSAIIDENVLLGTGNVIAAGSVINTGAIIGNHCIINTRASVDHDCQIKDYASVSPGAILGGNVILGRCSLISMGTVVLQNIRIGNNSIAGARALINKRIGNKELWFGTPAKFIRDVIAGENYFKNNDSSKKKSSSRSESTVSKKKISSLWFKTIADYSFYELQYSQEFYIMPEK